MSAGGVDSDTRAPRASEQFLVTTDAGRQLTGRRPGSTSGTWVRPSTPDVEVYVLGVRRMGTRRGRSWRRPPRAFLDTHASPHASWTAESFRARRACRCASHGEDTAAPRGCCPFASMPGGSRATPVEWATELAARSKARSSYVRVPSASMPGGHRLRARTTRDRPTLIVDEAFESALCRPYATLGGWSR